MHLEVTDNRTEKRQDLEKGRRHSLFDKNSIVKIISAGNFLAVKMVHLGSAVLES